MTQALQTIERRVNELGVAEPIVARHGDGDQILVQLPGVSDVRRAKEIIRSTAMLELKIVEQGPFPSEEALQAYNNVCPRIWRSCPDGAKARHGGHGRHRLLRREEGSASRETICATRSSRSTSTTGRPWRSR